MKIKDLALSAVVACTMLQLGQVARANESAPATVPISATRSSNSDLEQRQQEALRNIQTALDEYPEEASKTLGSTPVSDLDLESLEVLGEKALDFVQQKQVQQQMLLLSEDRQRMQNQREQQEERARLQARQNRPQH